MAGDKYSKARALSKIFEEFLARHSGDHDAAKKDMDDKIGPSWIIEIESIEKEDQGSQFLPDEVPRGNSEADIYETDDMLKKAREFSESYLRPDADLRNDVIRPKDSDKKKNCVSEQLREIAKMLEED